VLNAGVEGYNSENELALLERSGLALAPETVVVAFNLNDFDYGPVMGPMGILTLERDKRVSSWSLSNLSEFYLLLKWLAALGWQRAFGPAPPAAAAGRPELTVRRVRPLRLEAAGSSTMRSRMTAAGRRWSSRSGAWPRSPARRASGCSSRSSPTAIRSAFRTPT
jgi:hypothetical protein